MWLLSTDRAELHYFLRNFDAIGGYAILSHTWNGDEQTLQQVQAICERCRASGTNPRDDPALSQKIRNCCIIAESHGYRWVWIDSCCIDKTSSSELSEAINSMFRWYKEAEVCFAYLADVPGDCAVHAPASAFRKSRWHTRGWTLQELIASDILIFLSSDWRELGNRAVLSWLLWEITGVPSESGALTGEYLPGAYSVSNRMSWASNRNTTRVEDEAYCLMGLFGVSMPTNYGEGKKAFIRLQYEIMQHNLDLSLFAFSDRVDQDHDLTFHPEEEIGHRWQYLMADSPRGLNYGFDYIPLLGTNTKQQYPPPIGSQLTGPFDRVELPRATATSYGVELRVPIYETDGMTIAVILCTKAGQHIGLCLRRDSQGRDPDRPRYFTGFMFTKQDTGSARLAIRLAHLGDDLYNMTFNGRPVKASWRTIYVVPVASGLDPGGTTTPNLMINGNPASYFRIPRWLIARLTALQFRVNEISNPADRTYRGLKLFDGIDTRIYLSFGLCTMHHDSGPDRPPPLWAKVDVAFRTTMQTFTHNCSEDHLDSQSWAARSKSFGDIAYRGVRLSLMASSNLVASNSLFVIHLELLGLAFQTILQEAGSLSMFPSLAELQRDTPRPISHNPITPSGPLSLSQMSPNTSSQAFVLSSNSGSRSAPYAWPPSTVPSLMQPGPSSASSQAKLGIYSFQPPYGCTPTGAAGTRSPYWQGAPPQNISSYSVPPLIPQQHLPAHGFLPPPSQSSSPYIGWQG